MSRLSPLERTGRGVLSTAAVVTAAGGFAADWNRTHLFNPKWPPHAKFHDAMTIILGTLLGGASLFFLWRKRRPSPHDWALGAMLPGFFFTAQAASFAFPETGGIETEFPRKVPRVAGIRLNERPFSLIMLAVLAIGYLLGRANRRGERGGKLHSIFALSPYENPDWYGVETPTSPLVPAIVGCNLPIEH